MSQPRAKRDFGMPNQMTNDVIVLDLMLPRKSMG